MKVLLLAEKFSNNLCCSRSHFYSMLLQEYLEAYDINISIKKFIYDGRRLNKINLVKKQLYPDDIDYIILINYYGFSKKGNRYIDKLKEFAKKGVISLCYSNKFKMSEDMIFFTKHATYSMNNGICIDYFSDPSLCFPETKNDIWIMIDEGKNKMNENIFKYVKDSFQYTKINVLSIYGKVISYYDIEGDKVSTECISNFLDFFKIFRKLDIYFVSSHIQDQMRLADLCMCNVLIVGRKNIIPKYLISKFEIYEENDFINWEEIFKKRNTLNIREKMILNGMTSDHAFHNIYNYLVNNNINNNITKKKDDKNINSANNITSNIINDDNAINDNITNNTIINDKKFKNDTKHKKKVILNQSNILNMLKL